MKLSSVGALCLISFIAFSCHRQEVYKVYYLGGQSNMDGYGYVSELPAELNQPLHGIYIFHGNTGNDLAEVDGKGIWSELQPGHGVGFVSDGHANTLSDRFGVELSFAWKMKELDPGANIALIKYSKGGTSIDTAAAGSFGCWSPQFTKGNGVNQYDHFKQCITHALANTDINGDGKPEKLLLSGIVWMQGESDADKDTSIARIYEMNLTMLMDSIRLVLGASKIPVVIGRISESGKADDGKVWDFGDIVREGQAAFVQKDGNAALVTSTDNYSYSDPWHYDSKGYIDLGEKFAEAMFSLQKKN